LTAGGRAANGKTMARLARTVVPGVPHHVTQRGNGGVRTFFCGEDYAFYKELLELR
jgi:putative transposase